MNHDQTIGFSGVAGVLPFVVRVGPAEATVTDIRVLPSEAGLWTEVVLRTRAVEPSYRPVVDVVTALGRVFGSVKHRIARWLFDSDGILYLTGSPAFNTQTRELYVDRLQFVPETRDALDQTTGILATPIATASSPI